MQEPYKMFWTGGWDSTFLLLSKLLIDKRTVEPVYLIDSRRPSTRMELRSIDKIKRQLLSEKPELHKKILPMVYCSCVDIPRNTDTSLKFDIVAKKYGIGSQYAFIVRFQNFCSSISIAMAVHSEDKLASVLKSGFESGTPEHELFGKFKFPLLDMTKLQIQATAREMGFLHLMDLTWFCHKPVGRRRNKTCGTCNPCRYTMEEGMGRRLNFRGKIAYHLARHLGL